MFSQGLFKPSSAPPAAQRTRHSGMLLHSTQPNLNVVFASGTPSILRETPVAFSASSRPRSHARSLATNTYGLSSTQKYKVSARIAALAQPKRHRDPYNNEDETPWYPAGAHIVAEPTQRKWVPKGKKSPTKKNSDRKSHPSPVHREAHHQPPVFDSEAIDADTAVWEPQIDWEVTNRCTVKDVGCNGTVRWKGVFVGNGLPMIGIELDYAFGDGDGVFLGKHRLFRCPDNCAVLVDPIDVLPPLDDCEVAGGIKPNATAEEKEQAQYLTKQRLERRKSIADAGFEFKYLQLPGLLTWEAFASEPSYLDVPAGLVRLLFDYYLEESEQCHLLREALDLVADAKNQTPYSKSAMEDARRSLEQQIERGLAIQTLHHEELETVCTHIEYQGDMEGLILHSGGMLEADETGSPKRRDHENSTARDQQIKDRMHHSSKAEQFEQVMLRLASLNLDKDAQQHLEELAKEDLAHATETVLALEQLPEHQEQARQARVAQMTSQWEHLKVEHEVLRDRVTLATPGKSNNLNVSNSHENQGLHHAASKASLEEAATVTKMTKQWTDSESPQR
eukprot:m.251729 g.251729  ORF g.251729 m.251729 type:complete len:564 (+) comp33901_c1_seq2:166-1857(+)